MEAAQQTCDNCHALKQGRFCFHCGQNDRDFNRPLWGVVKDIFREVFEVDSRIFRTLATMIRRPGRLSVEFAANRRASFVGPIRLYLFASILYFFGLTVSINWLIDAESEERLVKADKHIPEMESRIERDQLAEIFGPNYLLMIDEVLLRPDTETTKVLLVVLLTDMDSSEQTPTLVMVKKMLIKFLRDPAQAINNLFENLPVAMFVLLPFHAMLLKIFYWRSNVYIVHHLVFSMHLHAYSFSIYLLLWLLPVPDDDQVVLGAIASLASFLLFVYLNVYIYLAFRRFYGQSHFLTFLKLISAGTVYLMVTGTVVMAVLVIGVWPD